MTCLQRHFLAACLLALAAGPVSAGCFADYKAKIDGPLRLHYGVIALPDQACGSPTAARATISARISKDGWTLLNVLSIFGNEGLAGRKASAGAYYLRY